MDSFVKLSFNAKAALGAGLAATVILALFDDQALLGGIVLGGALWLGLKSGVVSQDSLRKIFTEGRLQRRFMQGLPSRKATPFV